jgi:hypothetical protein
VPTPDRPRAPRVLSPRTAALLWAVAGASAALAWAAWSAEVPRYAQGLAVAVPGEAAAVLVPIAEGARLQIGREVVLPDGRPIGLIEAVEPDPADAVAAADRFGVAVPGPVAVARARLEGETATPRVVRVRIGVQRLPSPWEPR